MEKVAIIIDIRPLKVWTLQELANYLFIIGIYILAMTSDFIMPYL